MDAGGINSLRGAVQSNRYLFLGLELPKRGRSRCKDLNPTMRD